MKKLIFILAAVLGIVLVVYLADKTTRLRPSVSAEGRSQSARANAPDFSLRNMDGTHTSLAQYKGKVVLVNFWATWCAPCRVEIPWLIGMQQKYGPRGFTVVGLAMDDEEEAVVVPFVSKEKFSVNGQQLTMNYPILIGTAEVADKFGGLLGFPTSVLISKDGKVVTTITGIIDEDAMSKKIESELE
jgi:thiol-disulfide isomerase/thioredoxin